ncbi:DHA2 family efflux MFS transporter permease subunit [Desulfotomaculum copahuensis]|uniref:MFS transporter n=1 Tax=Desulfotomaculum copahuensis TaxID=1838280 RepID=A0A1B7LCR2_9FIRM|nr:DHA2 family efflux MFS transporter permease subunit [Desulfotomaculum copahuensis]OAT80699.1 MFS transporter [Desulfotomaculum copahuensis]
MQTDAHQENASFWVPLFVVVLGAFAAILNNSSVNVAIPKMMSIFGANTDEIQWVLTAYMLTSGVVIPVTGFLGDYLGSRRLYIIALGVFTAGSFLCSISLGLNTMIAARVVQGIGGGVIMPVSMAIIYKIVPRQKIGMALGVWGVSAVAAPAVGPTLGGYVIDHLSWRFLFTMNIPVGVLGLILALLLLPGGDRQPDRKPDFWGFALSTGGCFALLLALSEAHKDGWGSQFIVTLLATGFAALILFVLVELNIEQPMLELRTLKNPVFSLSILAASLNTMGLFGGVFLMPLFTQNLMGLTPMQTGLLLMPSAIATALTMPVAGFLFDRLGAVVPGVVGLSIAALGTWELHNLSLATSYRHIQMIMVVRALGIGLAMMPITTAGMNTVSRALVGQASALSNVCRQIAASFGIALLTSILQQRQYFHSVRLAEAVTFSSPLAHGVLQEIALLLGGGFPGNQRALTVIYGLTQREAFVRAIDDTFMVAAVFVAVAVPMVMFLHSSHKARREPPRPPGPPKAADVPAGVSGPSLPAGAGSGARL